LQAGTFVASELDSYDTESLRKISFVGDEVIAEFKDGGSVSYDFSSFQRIYFVEPNGGEATGNEVFEAETELFAYPNPVTDRIFVKGLPESATVSIFNVAGTVVSQGVANDGVFVKDVSDLPNGVYFLQFDGKVLKFIKR
jgi:hypothetical protein